MPDPVLIILQGLSPLNVTITQKTDVILQTRKLRFKEVKELSQGHIACKQLTDRDQDWNPDSLTLEPAEQFDIQLSCPLNIG